MHVLSTGRLPLKIVDLVLLQGYPIFVRISRTLADARVDILGSIPPLATKCRGPSLWDRPHFCLAGMKPPPKAWSQ
jgi:hypothetical protein